MKVELQRRPHRGWWNHQLGRPPLSLTHSLPFYTSNRASPRGPALTHRVRSGYYYDLTFGANDRRQFLAFQLWCGQGGSSKRGYLTDTLHRHDEFCALCEARALRAGLPSNNQLLIQAAGIPDPPVHESVAVSNTLDDKGEGDHPAWLTRRFLLRL
jgi:hypothetical protein